MSSAKTPTVAVLAGINGAGKTSSALPILTGGLRIPVFVNADTIARGLNAFDVESEAVKAGRIMLAHLDELDSPDTAIERVAIRVASGGHYIPEETIRRRYARSVRNFLDLYRSVVTTWQVYETATAGPG